MKILYISQYFPPEMGAPAARVSELSAYWQQQGHQVTVLTGFPNHPTGIVPAEYRGKLRRLIHRESFEGVRVERTWLVPLPNRKSWERIINYASFSASAMVRGLSLSRPDVIIATSPQLLVGLTGLVVSKMRRIPLVFEVRDLWPESLVAVGVSGNASLLNRSLGALAGKLYRDARHIVVVSPAYQDHIVQTWKIPAERISVVMNGVRPDFFSVGDERREVVKKEFHIDRKFVVSFIGTIGNAHGLGIVIEAAQKIHVTHPDIVFLIVGEGAEKQRIEEQIRSAGLRNVRLVPGQPRERVPHIIRASDVCLVLLKKSEVFKTVIPTKMQEFLACGRPVILGVEGEAARILLRANAGFVIPPEDPDALNHAIFMLYESADLRRRLGNNGRSFAVKFMSRETTATQYLQLLSQLLDDTSTPEDPAVSEEGRQASLSSVDA